MRIMIACNDENVQNSLAFILENNGCQIEQVQKGWEVPPKLIDLQKANQPTDLLILDVDIDDPRIELLLVEMIWYGIELPTLVMVGLLNGENLDRFNHRIPIELLRIPFSEEHLLNRISQLLQRQKKIVGNVS